MLPGAGGRAMSLEAATDLLDPGLQVLHEELPQVVQRLQLLGDGLLEALEVLLRLLAPLQLQRDVSEARALVVLLALQSLVVARQLLLRQRQRLVRAATVRQSGA